MLLPTQDRFGASVTSQEEHLIIPPTLHITSGDCAGDSLGKSGIPGEVFVWHDILYDGPRKPGWPDEDTLQARAAFLDDVTGGGLGREEILRTLRAQYVKLAETERTRHIVLWFDACLFDQSMFCHILACMKDKDFSSLELLCVDAYPGIVPYHGLGQLSPEQLASVWPERRAVTAEQFHFAERVDEAFAIRDLAGFEMLSQYSQAPLPHVPAAVGRWLREQPDEDTGLGLLEKLILQAISSGCSTPQEIFAFAAAHDTPPQYWTDITLWRTINRLATRPVPLLRVEGPSALLPQWDAKEKLPQFRIFGVNRTITTA